MTTYPNLIITPDSRPDLGWDFARERIVVSTVCRVSCPACGLLDKVRSDDNARLTHLDRAHAKCQNHD
jgi:hypothetical protein